MVWRVQFTVAGGHVHCRLFVGPAPHTTVALCGKFVVRRGAEFLSLLKAMRGVDFVGDDEKVGIAAACEEEV